MQRAMRNLLSILVLAAGGAHAAPGDNLVVNPEFSDGMTGWQTTGPVAYDTQQGSPSLGSARMDIEGAVFAKVEQCVDVSTAVGLEFRIYWLAVNSNGPTSAGFELWDTPGCTGTRVSTETQVLIWGGPWESLRSTTIFPTHGAKSMSISVSRQGTTGESSTLYVDHVSVVESATPVTLQTFDVD